MACRSTKPLQWGENFTVGHAEIDAQHRRLVDLINDIEVATHAPESPERRVELLKTLREAAAEHMRQENVILWEIRSGSYAPLKGKGGTPYFLKAMAESAFDEHMAEHATLLAELDAISRAPDDALCEAIKSWFILHAIKHDSRLKAIFQAM
ncbi:MAG TPA: hemerythrin family protein [Stellaceae bacterium]|nr:hemerythrin family protein [Stellaceae bacterium]